MKHNNVINGIDRLQKIHGPIQRNLNLKAMGICIQI